MVLRGRCCSWCLRLMGSFDAHIGEAVPAAAPRNGHRRGGSNNTNVPSSTSVGWRATRVTQMNCAETEMLAGLHSLPEVLGRNFLAFTRFWKPPALFGLWPLSPSSKPATSGQFLLTVVPLLPPVSTCRDPFEDTGLTQTVQDHLPSPGQLISNLPSTCNRPPPLCHVP